MMRHTTCAFSTAGPAAASPPLDASAPPLKFVGLPQAVAAASKARAASSSVAKLPRWVDAAAPGAFTRATQ
jgi:hypothetical protein